MSDEILITKKIINPALPINDFTLDELIKNELRDYVQNEGLTFKDYDKIQEKHADLVSKYWR